jgi:1-phosphofructokinase family hexose kinase
MAPLVLALNPSIDTEWRVTRVLWGEKNTILSAREWPGGKGINVVRWMRHLEQDAKLLVPLGGATGSKLRHGLQQEKLPIRVIRLRHESRINVVVSATDGRQLRFNPPGPDWSAAEKVQLWHELRRLMPKTTCLTLSGSLPPGLPVDTYARAIRLARQAGVKTVLDCDGPAFKQAVRTKPFLVKPNEHELAQWRGRPLISRSSILQAARSLSAVTGGWVLVSRGRQAAFLINQKEKIELSLNPPRTKAINTVGAGDAMLAAVTRELEKNALPEEWLRWGVAAGTAAVGHVAGKLPPYREIVRLARKLTVQRIRI